LQVFGTGGKAVPTWVEIIHVNQAGQGFAVFEQAALQGIGKGRFARPCSAVDQNQGSRNAIVNQVEHGRAQVGDQRIGVLVFGLQAHQNRVTV
jgi:hypothetical protein